MLLGEVVDVLAGHRHVRCQPVLECEDGALTLTVRMPVATLENVELMQELRHVTDMHQLRVLAERLDIDPAALEALLEKGK